MITPGADLLDALVGQLQESQGTWLDEVQVEGIEIREAGMVSIAEVEIVCDKFKVIPPGVEVTSKEVCHCKAGYTRDGDQCVPCEPGTHARTGPYSRVDPRGMVCCNCNG